MAPADRSRRRFVGWCAGASTGAAMGLAFGLGTAAPAGAQSDSAASLGCESMTVWRLTPSWDTPRGPHGKTELKSKASRIAADHRWALTEQDALDMNLHKCSWAPAVPVQVRRKEFMEIWNHDGNGAYRWSNPWNNTKPEIFDTRCLDHIPDGYALWAQAMDTTGCTTASRPGPDDALSATGTDDNDNSLVTFFTATGATPTSTSTSTPTSPLITRAIAAGGGPESSSALTGGGQSASSGFGRAPSTLAFTGADSRVLGVWGASIATAGAGLLAFARRRRAVELQAAKVHAESARDHRLKLSDGHDRRSSSGLR